jgi:hypothetical protein
MTWSSVRRARLASWSAGAWLVTAVIALALVAVHCGFGTGDDCGDDQCGCDHTQCLPSRPPTYCASVDAGVCGIFGPEQLCQEGDQAPSPNECTMVGSTDAGTFYCCGAMNTCAQVPAPNDACPAPSIAYQCAGGVTPVLACAETAVALGATSFCCLSGKACAAAPSDLAAAACPHGTTTSFVCSPVASPPDAGSCSVVALDAGAHLYCCT